MCRGRVVVTIAEAIIRITLIDVAIMFRVLAIMIVLCRHLVTLVSMDVERVKVIVIARCSFTLTRY